MTKKTEVIKFKKPILVAIPKKIITPLGVDANKPGFKAPAVGQTSVRVKYNRRKPGV